MQGEGNLKMFFWPHEALLGEEELELRFLENTNRFSLQQEEVWVDRSKHFPMIP